MDNKRLQQIRKAYNAILEWKYKAIKLIQQDNRNHKFRRADLLAKKLAKREREMLALDNERTEMYLNSHCKQAILGSMEEVIDAKPVAAY